MERTETRDISKEALAGLSDAEVQDRRIRGLVATRTYLHWDEHEQDLGL